MKLSLAWVFDHIDADWNTIDVPQLINLFNQKVAEIEGYSKIHINLEPLTLVEIINFDEENVIVFSKEWGKEYTLSMRKGITIGQNYLVKKNEIGFQWANALDIGSGKDMHMPALVCSNTDNAASWKQQFESHDYILELDNKSITHRPDMWGHRGFAREIAALLDLPFKPLHPFLATKKITKYDTSAPSTQSNPFSVRNDAPQACKRIAGIYLDQITVQPSLLWMAHRLARVDARPIDAIVDATNYVMWELGQPMHAFSASSFGQPFDPAVAKAMADRRTFTPEHLPKGQGERGLVVRMAKNKERLTLLDGESVELTEHDLIISDGDKPLALAGVMGGANSGINSATHSILIESACFDAATVRKTAARYKKRTEASSRFEKSLDPNQNVTAIARFLKLLEIAHIQAIQSDEIFSLGAPAKEAEIIISHETIEQRLGVTLASDFIIKTLTALEFGVKEQNGMYWIAVPTFRGTKDVKIKEDIIEEIGRYYGYTTLETHLPKLQLAPSLDLAWVYQQRKIKQILAYACQMHELYTYAFFDEEFLATIKWQPSNTLEVQSPVSENWRRLVTTLIPNLLKSVVTNSGEHDQLRFFELARTWEYSVKTNEKKSLAGIFYDKKSIDFYRAKAELQKLFDMLKLDVQWVKVENPAYPWYAPYQTAHLMHKDTCIGIAGVLHPTFLNALITGSAFIFELDADFLLNYKSAQINFVGASKYPEMIRDISMLISTEMTAENIAHMIAQVDAKIINVSLLDFFEKDEWPDKRAMTFRFVISDHERTMTKEEADIIWDKVASMLKNIGAIIR